MCRAEREEGEEEKRLAEKKRVACKGLGATLALMRLIVISMSTMHRLTLKGCAKWPAGRILRWKKQNELYQLVGKALALS